MSENVGVGQARSPRGNRRGRRGRRLRLPAGIRPASSPLPGRDVVRRWQNYRERQLEHLAASNRLRRELGEESPHGATAAGTATDTGTTGSGGTGAGGAGRAADIGTNGPAATRQPGTLPGTPPYRPVAATQQREPATLTIPSPFYVGFVGALGVLTAWLLVTNLSRLSSVFTFVLVAVFLTLALNPIVESLSRRGASRGVGVLVVFVGLLGVFALLGFLVVPPIVQETATLIERAPTYLEDLGERPWVANLDARYGIGDRVGEEMENRLLDTDFISTLFGGVLGAAGWLAGGLIGLLTALILTLYFLAALPAVKDAAYRMVPASRRPRVISLAEEIMRRVGGYALGQVAVATINASCSWIVMEILSLPYAVVLAVLVGILGLVPMVGATLGAIIVAAVALFQDPTLALIVVVYYVTYQQIENYIIVPRIMARTVSVPGAVTVVAVLAGGTLLGVFGALIAIPVAAGLLLVYQEVVVPRQSRI